MALHIFTVVACSVPSEHFVIGTDYAPDGAAVEAIKAAGSEIELDMPQGLRRAVFGEDDMSSRLKPAPPSAPKPKGRASTAASSSGRGSGHGSGGARSGRGKRKVAVNRELIPEPFAAQHSAQ